MWEHLFKHIDIDPLNVRILLAIRIYISLKIKVNILDGNAEDLEAECRRFESKIQAVGGIDLFVGGLWL